MTVISDSYWWQTNTAYMLDLAVEYKRPTKIVQGNEEQLERENGPISFFLILLRTYPKFGHEKYTNIQDFLLAETTKASYKIWLICVGQFCSLLIIFYDGSALYLYMVWFSFMLICCLSYLTTKMVERLGEKSQGSVTNKKEENPV